MRDLNALLAFIESRHSVPYAWGRDNNDCVGFVLAAVEAQIGERPVKALRWSDQKGALRTIKRLGGLEAAFDKHFERIPPAMAQRGDIGGVPDPEFGVHPMIVEGDLLVGPDDKGNRRLPRRCMTMAWRAIPKATK